MTQLCKLYVNFEMAKEAEKDDSASEHAGTLVDARALMITTSLVRYSKTRLLPLVMVMTNLLILNYCTYSKLLHWLSYSANMCS